jgi:hypothetical protein
MSLHKETTGIGKNTTTRHNLPISVAVCLFFLGSVLFASTPDPGHPWIEVGDGLWAATGTTAYRTFTFPDASSTVLTTNAAVTVAQGGTGQTSTSSALSALSGLTAKGDLSVHNGTNHVRLPVGTNGYVLTADSASSTGMRWATPSASPSGSDTYVQINDGGVMGATSSFTFNDTTRVLGLDGMINLTAQSDPSPSATGTMYVYAKTISGRTMLKASGRNGVDYAYQPSFFQNSIFIISTGGAAAYNTVGNTLTSVGTITHVASESLGYMANQVTGTTAGNTAGTGSATTPYFRGTQDGSNGFFMQARMGFPTATTTGARYFIGFTDGTMAASVSGDNPAGSHIGWQYSTARGDTGWKFMTRNGATQTVSSTVLAFGGVNDIMDFFIYCPPYPNNTIIYYRIDNITQGTTAEGQATSTLPAGSTQLRAGFQMNNITAVGKNIRMGRFYVETDK